jgi:hypothetical protein
MTKPAREHIGLAAARYDVRQWPMVARVPDGRVNRSRSWVQV